jgi:hypothetical protein
MNKRNSSSFSRVRPEKYEVIYRKKEEMAEKGCRKE